VSGSTASFEGGELVYSPKEGFFGKDTVEYEVCSKGTPFTCASAKVFIEVSEVVDESIVAVNDEGTTSQDLEVRIDVLANDFDVDSEIDTTSLKVLSVVSGSTASFEGGELVYSPKEGFSGKDTVEYEVCSKGTPFTCASAKVFIEVNEVITVVAEAGEDINTCSLFSQLNATPVNIEGYTTIWSSETNGVTFENDEDAKTIVTLPTGGTYKLYWIIRKDGNIESLDSISITSENAPQAVIVQNDFFTEETSVNLEGNDAEFVKWTTTGSAVISEDNETSIEVTNLALGVNTFVYQVGEECPTYDSVKVTHISPIFADAGKDTVVCTNSYTLVADQIPNDATGTWTKLLTDATIVDETTNITEVTSLTEGINMFVWSVDNGLRVERDTIIVYGSLNAPNSYTLTSDTIETRFEIDINPKRKSYNQYTYDLKASAVDTIGSASISEEGMLEYLVYRAALGRDIIYYTTTDQCNRSSESEVALFIRNSKPLEGEAIVTIQTGAPTEFNIVDSIYIFDRNYNLDTNSFIVLDSITAFGALADTIGGGNIALDYTYVTDLGEDSLKYKICDDSLNCLEAYLKIKVLPPFELEENPFIEIDVFNAVSPNDDGVQDFLLVEYLFEYNEETEEVIERFPGNKLTIFDRWGKIVAEIENYDNDENRWEGTDSDGKKVPPGTYFYAFRLDENYFKSGFIIVNY
ncbi:MAG: T9SS type B sorting domain-containing protein, partial [Cytophagales bacterium]|nr:T9SS type B sorting domain-containing protein [Cytophagales bacterium]